MEKRYWIYILADKPFGTLYLGVTNNLARRAYEHREGMYEGFSKQQGIKDLVYYEEYSTALDAIAREKRLKKWKRNWKLDLIKKFNPDWKDLYETLNQ